MIRFLVTFLFLVFFFYFLLEVQFLAELFPIEKITDKIDLSILTSIFQFLYSDIIIENNQFKVQNAIMVIEPACHVLRVLLLFLSFIIAYPSSLSLKIRWSIYSIIFLELLNIFRIVVLSWVLINYPQYFNFMHDYVLSVILLLIVAIFYYKYINIANQNFSIITSKIDKG